MWEKRFDLLSRLMDISLLSALMIHKITVSKIFVVRSHYMLQSANFSSLNDVAICVKYFSVKVK